VAGVALFRIAVLSRAPSAKKAIQAPAPVQTKSSVAATDSADGTAADAAESVAAASGEVTLGQVETIMTNRCVECHAQAPTSEMFAAAPLGIVLDSQQEILLQADHIKQVVASKSMPLGNMTGMSDARARHDGRLVRSVNKTTWPFANVRRPASCGPFLWFPLFHSFFIPGSDIHHRAKIHIAKQKLLTNVKS